MASGDEINRISIQCVDNADGFPGVVVYGDKTFPIRSQQDAVERMASGDGQGPYSFVRPFQFAHNEPEDMEATVGDPPETDSNSLSSLQEEQEDEKMTGGLYSNQPST